MRFESCPDVEVSDMGWIVDCKAWAKFAHVKLIETVKDKYCGPGEVPMLICREPRGEVYATIPLATLAELLDEIRQHRKENT